MKMLDETRKLILLSIKEGFDQEQKADESFVTSVDRKVEALMRRTISQSFPDHGIIGEEHGVTNKDVEYIWYLDPIDGTAEFIKGLQQYGTLLSLYHKGNPVVGFIDHPSLNLRLHALRCGGSYINGQAVVINDVRDESLIENEVIALGPRFMFEKQRAGAIYDRLIAICEHVEEVQNCHWHTRLLQGEFGAVVDYGLRSWDISPVKILVEEAGGKFVKVEEKLIDGKDRHAIIFGKPKVVDRLVNLTDV